MTRTTNRETRHGRSRTCVPRCRCSGVRSIVTRRMESKPAARLHAVARGDIEAASGSRGAPAGDRRTSGATNDARASPACDLPGGSAVMRDASSRLRPGDACHPSSCGRARGAHRLSAPAGQAAAVVGGDGRGGAARGPPDSPIFARLLPFGLDGRVAAIVMGVDRWNAGSELMSEGNPEAWKNLMAAANLSSNNRDAVNSCREAVLKSGKPQRCEIVVSVPERRN